MMDALPREDVRTRVVSDAIKRRWPSILIIALVIGGGVGGYLFTRPHTYSSATTVLLRPLSANALSPTTSGNSQSTAVAMETEASLVGSQPVTDRVNSALHLSLVANGSGIKASVPVNSQIIKINYTASSATLAQRVAQSYADSFLAYRTQLAATARDDQVRRLETQRTAVEADLTKQIGLQHGKNPPPDVQTQIDLDKTQLSSILDQIAQTNSAPTDAGSVILPATKAYPPSKLKPAVFTAAALVVGAIIGFMLALWRERRDDRVRPGLESSPVTPRLLATIPDGTSEPMLREEALRQARAMLLAVAAPNTTVAVAGVSADDDGTALAGDLARTLAAAGYRTALLDASIRSASAGAGLSDLLMGDLPDDLPFVAEDGVARLAAGTDPSGARERYSGAGMRRLLSRLRLEFDFVLVGTSPVSSGDGQAVALATDGLVLTATELLATNEQIRAADETAYRLGVTVLGLILRKPAGGKHKAKPADAAVVDDPSARSRRRGRANEPKRAQPRRAADQPSARRRDKSAANDAGMTTTPAALDTAADDAAAEGSAKSSLFDDRYIVNLGSSEIDAPPQDGRTGSVAQGADSPPTRRTRRRNARRAGAGEHHVVGDDALPSERVSVHRVFGGGADSEH
jgi:capsular polysaccharide biosynthesis protein/Mrp family chromosome partitioning ATPase